MSHPHPAHARVRSRLRWLATLAATLLTLGFLAVVTSGPAGAQAALPSPPQVTILPAQPGDGIDDLHLQISLAPGDESFAPQLTGFEFGVTSDPNATEPVPAFDPVGIDGHLTIQVAPVETPPLYGQARAMVTLQDGSVYTTPWSAPIPLLHPDGGTPTPTPPPTSSPPPPPTMKIGAWGDSYISGEGAKDPNLGYLPGTDQADNHCHRSSLAFPALIAQQRHMELDFHACSGAVMQDFYAPFSQSEYHPGTNPGEPAQLDTVSSQDSIGFVVIDGNNLQFSDIMNYCATRQLGQPSCEKVFGKFVDRKLNQLNSTPNLAQLYRDVHSRMAPGAKLYVVGYPRFFPANPPKSCNTGVPGLPVPVFSKSDMIWINLSIARLDAINARAAAAAGVKFINVYDAFAGHEICNQVGNTQWMNKAIRSLNKYVQAGSFHPNLDGQQAEARWITARMG